MSVGVGSNGAEQDKAINAGLFGSGERSFPGLPSIKRIHLDTRFDSIHVAKRPKQLKRPVLYKPERSAV